MGSETLRSAADTDCVVYLIHHAEIQIVDAQDLDLQVPLPPLSIAGIEGDICLRILPCRFQGILKRTGKHAFRLTARKIARLDFDHYIILHYCILPCGMGWGLLSTNPAESC
jgi:hypothetical protein